LVTPGFYVVNLQLLLTPAELVPPSITAQDLLGKIGWAKGGKVRAAKLSPERRSEIARKAVLARWAKRKNQEQLPK
jgi:hypothetical protein